MSVLMWVYGKLLVPGVNVEDGISMGLFGNPSQSIPSKLTISPRVEHAMFMAIVSTIV